MSMKKNEDKKSKVAQSRSWILTLPFEEYDKETVESKLGKYVYTGQLELGESGYEHWQVYIEHKTPIKFDTLRNKFPKGHYEKRQGSRRQAFEYVNKEDTFAGVRISNGEIDIEVDDETSTKLTRLRDEMVYEGKSMRELLKNESPDLVSRNLSYIQSVAETADYELFGRGWRDVKVEYIWGESGVGKTSGIYKQHGYDDVYRVNDFEHPFDNYEREDVLVLDEFYSQLKFSTMLQVIDGHPVRLPARYRDRYAGFTKVYVVSNIPFSQQYHNVQLSNEKGWRAFVRRFDSIKQMIAPGEFIDETSQYKPQTDISVSM